MEVSIGLAGQNIRIQYRYPSTRQFLSEYIIEEEPQDTAESILVSIRMDDIQYEKEKSAFEDQKEGIDIRYFSDEYLETLAIYRQIAEAMIDKNILLFHGSAVAVDGQGYLFTAKSGTGKSTHTRLWREVFGQRAVMVNDDKPLLEVTSEGVIVHGTPWDGKHHLSNKIAVPLKGLCILKRSEDDTNRIHPITKRDAYPMLVQQSFRSGDPKKLMKSMELIDKISQIPLYELHCTMEPEAAKAAFAEMSGK